MVSDTVKSHEISYPEWDKVLLAREVNRPNIIEIIDALFDDFFEQQGDRLSLDDGSIYGGVALYNGKPVTVLGHCKGRELKEKLACNFGMPNPQGYRKALRIMQAADKFNRPIITFVDTPGAYPGIEAEENGQGSAIAQCIAEMSGLGVPIVSVITGEGGSGGALALALGNEILMAENATYSVLSPEGFASILWKDSARAKEASRYMKLTAGDLKTLGVIDDIIPEPTGGAHTEPKEFLSTLNEYVKRSLRSASRHPNPAAHRYKKFRVMGEDFISR